MKKIWLITAIMVASASTTFAQKVAYVDSEYVMQHIPEYKTAQTQFDDLSKQWQDDIDQKYAAIEDLYKAYQNDQPVLNADMRKRREDEIVRKEKEVKDLQKQRFGYEGELFKRREQVIKPLQDRVAKAIAEIAKSQGIDLIMDKSSETQFLYANPALDKSNEVITKLGLKPDAALAK